MAEPAVRVRAVALPAEHGSWGLVAEPIALGLLLAPSTAGACLGLGAFLTFLARRPLKVLATYRRRERSERKTLALRFFVLYGTLALLALALAALLAGIRPLVPLLVASPLVGLFLAYDLRNQGRAPQAELAGAVVFGLVTTGIVLTAGWPAAPAFALAAVLVGRAVSSVLYVRSRIRLDRGKPHDTPRTIAAHVAALAAIAGLVLAGLLPGLVIVAFLALLVRALTGLSRRRRAASVRAIGRTEMGYGILTVALTAVGYWIGG
jgi:YwiC-like protein